MSFSSIRPWEHLTLAEDRSGAQVIRLLGPVFEEERSAAGLVPVAGVYTVVFSAPIFMLDFYNGDTATAIFNVNGEDFTVLPGGGYDPTRFGGEPSDTVFVRGTTNFLMKRFS